VAGLEVSHGNASSEEGEQAPSATSDAEGRFELPITSIGGQLVAGDEDWVTIYAPVIPRGERPEQEPIITVAPRRAYAGIVVDEAGLPLADVEVAVHHSEAWRRMLANDYISYVARSPSFETDAQGVFQAADIGYTAGAFLHVRHPGYELAMVPLPARSDGDMTIELQPVDASVRTLRGVVVDGASTPVEGAYVSCGLYSATSASDGSFVLELEEDESPERIRAVYKGFLPASAELGPEDSWPNDLRLVLGAEPLELAGRVVDEDGKPVAGARVWSLDRERFGEVMHKIEQMNMSLQRSVEQLIHPDEDDRFGAPEAITDASGQFLIRGLLPRAYRLVALHPVTLAISRVHTLEAGRTDSRLLIRTPAHMSPMAGRVLTLDGEPLAGVRVRLARRVVVDGEELGSKNADTETVTDAGGHFAFASVAVEGLEITLDGPHIARSQKRPRADEPDLEALEFRVPAKCYFRVELSEDSEADGMALLDEDGEKLDLTTHMGNLSLAASRFDIHAGRSPVLEADSSARTLVIYSDGEELLREPVRFELTSEVQVLRP
jgi:hypothetical protein